jgi:hypothetical protein
MNSGKEFLSDPFAGAPRPPVFPCGIRNANQSHLRLKFELGLAISFEKSSQMKLPNANKAIVQREKIVDYLLNPAHPDNSGKAEFFETLGFRRKEWETLAAAFLALARQAEVAQSMKSPHGQKYVIVGRVESPGGKSPLVKTIWIVDSGVETARLVTAYPHNE